MRLWLIFRAAQINSSWDCCATVPQLQVESKRCCPAPLNAIALYDSSICLAYFTGPSGNTAGSSGNIAGQSIPLEKRPRPRQRALLSPRKRPASPALTIRIYGARLRPDCRRHHRGQSCRCFHSRGSFPRTGPSAPKVSGHRGHLRRSPRFAAFTPDNDVLAAATHDCSRASISTARTRRPRSNRGERMRHPVLPRVHRQPCVAARPAHSS